MLKNIEINDELEDGLIIIDKFGGYSLNVKSKTGMGVVYIAFQKDTHQILALKTFQDKFINDLESISDFKLESIESTKLKYHPNIVFSMGVQIIDERPFLIMEPILPNQDGRQSLNDYLDEKLSFEQILNWSIQFCYGMEFINEHEIKAHGDIKPENLLIDYRNQLKISDFGLLELFDTIPEDNIKGTYPYMAPETFKGNYNIQTDIYAFGMVLYQLLNNGNLPFNAKNNFFEEWQELHETKSIPLTEPLEFNNIIQKCLDKNPQNRYSSFKELRNNLETIFSIFSNNEIYVPESNEISDEWYDLSIAHSYAQYKQIDLFKEYSKNLKNSENNNILLEYGIDLIYVGEYGAAIKIFKKILNKISKSDEKFNMMDRLYFNMGHAYHELNRLYDAEEYYLKCLDTNNEYSKSKVNLGNVYREIGDFEKSLSYYNNVLREIPNFYEAIYNKALLLGKMNNLEEAEKLFDKIKYVKENKRLYYDKALMFYNENLMKSLIELSNIEIIDESDSQALFFMIIIHIMKGKPELAKDNYNKLTSISNNVDYKLYIASEYYNNGFEKESKEILDDLINNGNLNERNEALLLYSELIINKNIERSISIWDNILKSNAPNEFKSRVYVNKYLHDKRFNNKKNLDNALKLDQKNEIAHLNYVVYYADKKKWKKALKRIDSGLKFIPHSQELLFLKGRIYNDQKRYKLAIKYFKQSLKLGLPNIKTYLYLHNCYIMLYESKNAGKYFNYAINLEGYCNMVFDSNELLIQLIDKYLL